MAGAHTGAGPAEPLLRVEIAGCYAVVRGPVCELPEDRRLRLWVPAAAPEGVEVRVDGRPVRVTASAEQGGAALAFTVPPGGSEVSVRSASGRVHLALRAPRSSPAVTEAERLRKGGDLVGAAASLAAPLADRDPGLRGRAAAELARVALAQGRSEDAILRLREAAGLAAEAGRLSDEFVARSALAFTLIYNGRRFAEARAELGRLGSPDGAVAWAPRHEGLPYYEGRLAFETGDLRAALELLRESARRAQRLGADAYQRVAIESEASALGALGRGAEGEAALRGAERLIPAADPCARAEFLTNLGWLSLIAGSAGSGEGARRALGDASRLYADGSCAKPWARANVLTNLALAAIEAADPAEARARLAESRAAAGAAPPDARITVWWQDLEGRIALQDGRRAEALAAYERLARLADGAQLTAARWRAALGRALALEALGREGEAGAAYTEAEALLDQRGFLAPLGEGRETFLGRFEESGQQRVRFLLDRDAPAAAAAARRARARALAALRWVERVAGLDPADRARWDAALEAYRAGRDALLAAARDDWRLPDDDLAAAREARRAKELQLVAALEEALTVLGGADPAGAESALPSPGDGELFLVYHPIPGGLAAFAVTAAGVEARRLSAIPSAAGPAALAELLLEPFHASIDAAARLRILAAGPVDRVDFHALPWGGRALLAHAPIVYGIDRAGSAAPHAPGSATAVIVTDPLGDLAGARREARDVAALLAAAGYRVRILAGAAATRSAVREALESPDTDLFHHAGHGVFGGLDGWASALPLAGGESITVGDVLALRRVPRRIVLSACDTARSGAGTQLAGLGIGQAFVIAGADAVLAATRPVGDGVAARVMAAFHRDARATLDPAGSVRRAELEVLEADPGADVASFRLLVP